MCTFLLDMHFLLMLIIFKVVAQVKHSLAPQQLSLLGGLEAVQHEELSQVGAHLH